MIGRRGILGAFLAAPAVIRSPGLLMPVKWQPDWENFGIYAPTPSVGTQHVYISNFVRSIGAMSNLLNPMVAHFEHGRVVRLNPGEVMRGYVSPVDMPIIPVGRAWESARVESA